MKYFVRFEGQPEVLVSGAGDEFEIDGERFRVRERSDGRLEVRGHSRSWIVSPQEVGGAQCTLKLSGGIVVGEVENERDRLRAKAGVNRAEESARIYRSDIPGLVCRVLKKVGDTVDVGEPLLTLEAMKMENEIRADRAGRVKRVAVTEGQVVGAGVELMEVE